MAAIASTRSTPGRHSTQNHRSEIMIYGYSG